MIHVLDNPIWEALNSDSAAYAFGDQNVRFLNRQMGFFVGMRSYEVEQLQQLNSVLAYDTRVILFTPDAVAWDTCWKVSNEHALLQMVCEGSIAVPQFDPKVRPLKNDDLPKILSLIQLTKPGPFLEGTIDFGGYFGYFEGENLISMAGTRLRAQGFTEVSAVCTHPNFSGLGIAKKVVVQVLNYIQSRGQVPFLHLYPENNAAFRVYSNLGFTSRKMLHVYSVEKFNS